LAAAVLCLSARRPFFAACYLLLGFAGPLVLEVGILVPVVLVALWWAGGPGVTRRDVLWGVIGFASYAILRASFSGAGLDAPWFYAESGLGFQTVDREDLAAPFGHAPYLFWLYNVGATMFTVLFSEPRSGEYRFIASLIQGQTLPWQWINVTLSGLTTTVVAGVILRRRPEGHQRLLVVAGSVLFLAGSLLGFLYVRDRVALAAGAGYAILVYVATSLLVEPRAQRSIASLALALLLFAGWTWRGAGSMLYVRDRAFESYADWVLRYDAAGAREIPDAEIRETLHAAAMDGAPPDPRCDPDWTRRYFERLLSELRADCSSPPR
jgi:hypothetical protein